MSELPELIQALLDPEAYPDPTPTVELRETHISYVFLADDYVYKMKKPVDFGFLDYTTLEKRRFFCRKEVELNRRLCPDAYLGVVSVTNTNGHIRIGGKGKTVEYAVEMRHLPDDAMMNVLLAANKVTLEMMDSVAAKLAAFHKEAATGGDINNFGGIDTIIQNTDENFTQTEKYIGTTIPQDTYKCIAQENVKPPCLWAYLHDGCNLFSFRPGKL